MNDRIEVIIRDGKEMVRLKYPTAPGGQILRADVLADPEKLAKYINDWQVAWSHETVLRATDTPPKFDATRFMRLLDTDAFLMTEFERTKGRGNQTQVLQVLFNTYVLEDSAMVAAYLAA